MHAGRQSHWQPCRAPVEAQTVVGARTGPASVLDAQCKVHEIDQLYVVDASVLPSAGAVNTGLTEKPSSQFFKSSAVKS